MYATTLIALADPMDEKLAVMTHRYLDEKVVEHRPVVLPELQMTDAEVRLQIEDQCFGMNWPRRRHSFAAC